MSAKDLRHKIFDLVAGGVLVLFFLGTLAIVGYYQ